jgi:hypothetical protein
MAPRSWYVPNKHSGPAPSDLKDPCPHCGAPRYTQKNRPQGRLCKRCVRALKPRGVAKKEPRQASS